MREHTRNYMKAFSLSLADRIICEVCGSTAVDIHHIRGRRGKNSNEVENLVALCRDCHNKAHGIGKKITKEDLLTIVERRQRCIS